MVSLYNLGSLEAVYGTLDYLCYSLALVVLTIVAVMAIHHVLITRFRLEGYVTQQAIGYSCVIFAWIVVMALRMDRYCPVPGFDSLCFTTYRIPLGSFGVFPLNFAPIFLLFATSAIMPNASLVGHGAGVLLGYPLAWDFLSWITPPTLAGAVMLAILAHMRLDPDSSLQENEQPARVTWAGRDVDVRGRIREGISPSSSSSSSQVGQCVLVLQFTAAAAVGRYFVWEAVIPHAICAVVGLSSQCDFLSKDSANCLKSQFFYLGLSAVMAWYQCLTTAALLASWPLFIGYGLAPQLLQVALAVALLSTLVHVGAFRVCLTRLQLIPTADPFLRCLQLERRNNITEVRARAFSGRGNVLRAHGPQQGSVSV
eukprot:CAMPEP_0185792454 /NCGR_PEP_ID=MMETSP1174-20130828/158940_1 /TAXON_ID=35687 /ORGANISM="Dictyocha speculum, Strain CCMP1381" /LENGTH=369 /DNA_ID=CAMNT_0028487521 /DNA_START=611 /DNA_END=1720 /DNA_ORIENTATION=-